MRIHQKVQSQYGIWQSAWLLICLIHTRLVFRRARLVRLPIFLRGRGKIAIGAGFTCGYFNRLDAFGENGCISFGCNVELNDWVHIGAVDKVDIGDDVLIASRVFISDHDHGCYWGQHETPPDLPPSRRPLRSAPVRIENGVWIGENCSVLPGSWIGAGSVIGANSVVKGRIPPGSIAVGAPARVIKRFDASTGCWVRVE